MKSDAYWKQRALRREAESYKEADRTISKVLAAYDRAEEQINSDIKRIYSTFSDKGRLSKNEMDALMSANESQATLNRLRRQLETIKDNDIRRKALDRLNAKAYAARISRLQAVKTAIQAQTAKIADVQKTAMDEHLNKLTVDTYYKSIYDVQIGNGRGFSFSSLPLEVIDSILSEKLYGQDYSSRVWSNTELLAEEAYKVVSSGITAGMSAQRMARQLDEAMDDGRYAAVRLIRTETNRVFNASHLESYKAMGAKKYRFLATLDAKTCFACGKLDKKLFDIEKAVQGKNYPPLHPNDRCTTMAVIDGMTEKGMQRRAKDPVTGKAVFVPADMTYEQWVKQLNDKYGYDVIKAAQNTKVDKLQYRKYKKLLGVDNMPKSLEEFQKMKYNNSSNIKADYADLKYYAANINGRPIEYVKIDRDLQKLGVSGKGKAYPIEDIEIKSCTPHAERRMREANITLDNAIKWKEQAIVMLKKYDYPNTQFNYYSDNGVLGVVAAKNEVTGIIGKERFKSETKTILEVAKKWLKQ